MPTELEAARLLVDAIDLLAAFGEEVDVQWLTEKLRQDGSLDALEPLRAVAQYNGQSPPREGEHGRNLSVVAA